MAHLRVPLPPSLKRRRAADPSAEAGQRTGASQPARGTPTPAGGEGSDALASYPYPVSFAALDSSRSLPGAGSASLQQWGLTHAASIAYYALLSLFPFLLLVLSILGSVTADPSDREAVVRFVFR